eukprot:COSAG02_NODE_20857_length_813_cov_0.866947_1_plen_156_part_01
MRLGGSQRWVGEPGAILSGGVSVTGWKPFAQQSAAATARTTAAGKLTRWTAPLPEGAQAKTMRIGAQRAPQVAFPSVENTPAAAQYLFARQVNASTPTADIVRFDMDILPADWMKWTNLVAYTWPGSSWVGMRLQASPIVATVPDGDDHDLASFTF